MDVFSPSRSPALTGLLEAARLCYEDPARVVSSHLQEHLRHVAEARRHLDAQYNHNAKLRPRTPLFKEIDPQIRKQFEEFRAGLKLVERYLDGGPNEELKAGCLQARRAVDQLLDLTARLRDEEATFPAYSDSPIIHEIIHVALGVAKGEIPPEMLRARLDGFRAQVKRLLSDYGQWAQGTPETPAVADLLPQVEKGLTALSLGLDEMALFYLDKQKGHLRQGGELVLKASTALQNLQSRLHKALAPSPICPRCSLENPPGTRICTGCESRLPEVESNPTSMSIKVGGEAEAPRFAYVERVEEAVAGFRRGDVPEPELKATLEWFSQRVAGGRSQLNALKPPERFPSAEAERHAQAVRERMEKASQLLAEGAQRLLARDLDEGLDLVRQGAAEMADLQRELAPPR